MVHIASRSSRGTSGLVYDIHHIARLVLRLIGEDRHIDAHDEEASTSYEPSIKPPISSTVVRMQPI